MYGTWVPLPTLNKWHFKWWLTQDWAEIFSFFFFAFFFDNYVNKYGCWGCKSSGMWHCVVRWVTPNILKNCSSFKTVVTACPTTQHNISEDLQHQQHCSENLKSCNNKTSVMSQFDAAGWVWNMTSSTILFTESRKHELAGSQQNVHPK